MEARTIRCPGCAAELQWRKKWLGPMQQMIARTNKCGGCGHVVTLRDAKMMGEAFGYWQSHLRTRLCESAAALPKISPREAARLFNCEHAIDTLPRADGLKVLYSHAEHICRGLLLDGAHGHATELDVVLLETAQNPKFVGVFGFSPAVHPPRHWTVLVARLSGETFVLYTPVRPDERLRNWLPASESWAAAAGTWTDTTYNVAAGRHPAAMA